MYNCTDVIYEQKLDDSSFSHDAFYIDNKDTKDVDENDDCDKKDEEDNDAGRNTSDEGGLRWHQQWQCHAVTCRKRPSVGKSLQGEAFPSVSSWLAGWGISWEGKQEGTS